MPRKKLDYKELVNITPISKEEKLDEIVKIFSSNLLLEDIPDLDVWADENRILAQGVSSEYGRWVTDRFPFTRKIMKALSPSSKAEEIVWMKGCQVGATELAINLMFYRAAVCPIPILYTQKTKDAAEDFSKQKLAPNIECNPCVENVLGAKKPKYLSDEVLDKGFPGGFISMGGANSGAFLRSKSIGLAISDEEDSYNDNADKEGRPHAVIRKRGANYPGFKFYRPSTPKITETSTTEPGFKAGSQEYYYVPCPECNAQALRSGTYWRIKWDNITWPKDGKGKDIINPQTGIPDDIYLVCEVCGCRIDEHRKTWMLTNGIFMSEKDSPGRPYEVGDVENPSFHVSSLYSPYGFFSWRDAVKEWFEYKVSNDKELLQVFVNQTLGETFSLAGSDISYNYLQNRCELYTTEVPFGGLVLTAGADVQDDRIEIEVTAWGIYEESWSIDYKIFMGRTDTLGDKDGLDENRNPTAWKLLDEFIYGTYRNAYGEDMAIECIAIDGGYHTEQVHLFCRLRENRRVYPVKGHPGWGHGYIERPKKRHEKYHTFAFKVWVDEVKEKMYSMFLVDIPGPGYCHFPESEKYNERYFKGITAENRVVKKISGQNRIVWDCPSGSRNEPLDCRVYCFAALTIYDPKLQVRAKMRNLPTAASAGFGMEHAAPPPPLKKKKRIVSAGI